jgi:hypothetical protein
MVPDAPHQPIGDAAASLVPQRSASEERPCTVKAGLESVGVGTGWRRCGRVRSCSSSGLAPEAGGLVGKDCLREPALYRDDKAVDALVKTVSMATS